ncbi:MAG: DUF1963 domain-containing protein [Candidatus Obscuribacterales bacterium]|nr:DUF1963 domain-containing protein [Candidatus Obscuribacterales bacterium]
MSGDFDDEGNEDDDDEYGEDNEELSASKVRQILTPYERAAWIPVCNLGDGPVDCSKFSGIPYLNAKDSWPLCDVCKNPMQLILQLDLKEASKQSKSDCGEGLLQLFYCHHASKNARKNSFLRLLEPGDKPQKIEKSPVPNAYPAKRITGWTLIENDYPHSSELFQFEDDIECDIQDLADFVDRTEEFRPKRGDKLRGWHAWPQGADIHSCDTCGTDLELLMQIDSKSNLPLEFGSDGTALIAQCPVHKDQLRFDWSN